MFVCVGPVREVAAEEVIRGVERLPALSMVVRRNALEQDAIEDTARWYQDLGDQDLPESMPRGTYVPIDPCQALIAAIQPGSDGVMAFKPRKTLNHGRHGIHGKKKALLRYIRCVLWLDSWPVILGR